MRRPGRIGALLSVSGGIHPVLTGRENIYLYGAVLGLGRQIIKERFDKIVEFAGLGDAIDRQVKFYSIGHADAPGLLHRRLPRADILLVDEVLAVGDANFQQKCLRRIGEVVEPAPRCCTSPTTSPPSRRRASGPCG